MILFFVVGLLLLQHFYWKCRYLSGVVTILSGILGLGLVLLPTYVIEPESNRPYQEIGMCFVFLSIFSLIIGGVTAYAKYDGEKMKKIQERIWNEVDSLEGQDFFDAKILEIHENYILVKVLNDDLTETNKITVSKSVTKTDEFPADLTVGEIVRIAGLTDLDEDREIQLENPYGIFRLDSERIE